MPDLWQKIETGDLDSSYLCMKSMADYNPDKLDPEFFIDFGLTESITIKIPSENPHGYDSTELKLDNRRLQFIFRNIMNPETPVKWNQIESSLKPCAVYNELKCGWD